MSDQKPKIDLKARLGKKPLGSSPPVGGSTIPPGGQAHGSIPVPSGIPGAAPGASVPGLGSARPAVGGQIPGMPRPSGAPQAGSVPGRALGSGIPAPALRGGIPAPSLGSKIPAPQLGASKPAATSSPFAGTGVAAASPSRPQEIRIELGEEVYEAQRRGRKKVIFLAAVTALVGGVIGYAIGGGAERARGADIAVSGAQDLVTDISKASAEVQKLADTLKAAKDKLGKGEFPEAEVSALGAINIPFGGKNLAGKGIGRFKPELIAMLIDYANSASAANEQKEKLQNVLSGTKKGILELLTQRDKPQVRWSVVLGEGPGGPWVSMQPVPSPYPAKDKWPDEMKVGAGKQETVYKRYTSGNPGKEKDPLFLPVEPMSQASVCPQDVIFRLRREVSDLESHLRGDDTPGAEKTGLIDGAKQLTDKLKQIGREG